MATTTITQKVRPLPLAHQINHPPERRNVITTLNYYRDPGDGSPPTPVYVGADTVKNERPTVPMRAVIHDVTGEEAKYNLDAHGFQFVRHDSVEKDFNDDNAIESAYYAECEELYKQVTGASEAIVFEHRVRRGPTHWHALGVGNAANKGPLHRVHIDQSYAGAELILRKHFPARVDEVLKRGLRWQIINLWRPIKPIFKDPLAVAAAHSIPESDLIEAKVIYTKQPPPLNRNETWTILPNENHEWYFKNEQKPDEVLFIKCFDSSTKEGLARRVPHTAFNDSERGDEFENRQSIEIRGLLFYDE